MYTATIEVQTDHLRRQTRASAVSAVAELVWNAVDADATTVDVDFERGELGIERIVVSDNGHAFPHADAEQLFTRLGGSWKATAVKTKSRGRRLHGNTGQGRFKAFALGRAVEWQVRHGDGDPIRQYVISVLDDDLRQVRIGEEEEVTDPSARRGVTVIVSDVQAKGAALDADSMVQELTERVALYLADYREVAVRVAGHLLDPEYSISHRERCDLPPVLDEEGREHDCTLEIVEWRSLSHRALYLCNEHGFPLHETDSRFHVGNFQFSAYLRSTFVTAVSEQGVLELAEMNPLLRGVVEAAKTEINQHFRQRAAEQARRVVAAWKDEDIYPYQGSAKTPVETAARHVFEIVAVTASGFTPGFNEAPRKQRALHLRLLRSAIERSPEDLQLILREVLDLPKRKQKQLAGILKGASLAKIIEAASTVADRLVFLAALDQILFDADKKGKLKERTQLHQILADNTWFFGEEYNLAVNDQSLTEVLRKHLKLAGREDVVVDEPVVQAGDRAGRVDLMFSRQLKGHRVNELEHLVIELKRPSVKVGPDEALQIEKYAHAVSRDERFARLNVEWRFWVVSNELQEFTEWKADKNGVITTRGNITVGAKTWAQIIDENRTRLQFFQEKLEYQVDQGDALRSLTEKYEEFLRGDFTDDEDE